VANGEDAAALQKALREWGISALSGRPAGTESSVLEEALRAAAARREATDDQGFAEIFRPLEGLGVDATAEEMRQAIGFHLGWVKDMSPERFYQATLDSINWMPLLDPNIPLIGRRLTDTQQASKDPLGKPQKTTPTKIVPANRREALQNSLMRRRDAWQKTVGRSADPMVSKPAQSKVAEQARRKLPFLDKLSRAKVAKMPSGRLGAVLVALTLLVPTAVNLWDDSPGDDTLEATANLLLHAELESQEGHSEEQGNLRSPITKRLSPSPSRVKFGVRSPDWDDWTVEFVQPIFPATQAPGQTIASVNKEKLVELSNLAEEASATLSNQPLIMFNGTAANDITNPDSIYYIPFARERYMPSPDGKKIIKRDNGNADQKYRDTIYKTLQTNGLTGREFGEMSNAEQQIVEQALGITVARQGSGTDPEDLVTRYTNMEKEWTRFTKTQGRGVIAAEMGIQNQALLPVGKATQLDGLIAQQKVGELLTAEETSKLRDSVFTTVGDLVEGKINSIARQLSAQPGGPTDLTGRRIHPDNVGSEAESRLTQDPAVLRDLLLSATDAIPDDVIPPGVALTDLMVAEELNRVMRIRGFEDFDITGLTFSPPPGEEPELLRGDPGGAADMPQYIPDFGPETDLSAIPEERLESAVQSFVQQLAGQIANGDLQASQAAQISDFAIGIINQIRDPNNNKIYEIPGAASIENIMNYLPTIIDPKSENHDPEADALKVINMLGQFQNMYASQVEDYKRTQIQRDQLALSQERELQRQREAKATALAQLELQQNQFGRDFIGQLMRDKSSLPPIGVGRKIGGAEQYEALAKRYGVAMPQFDPIGVERIPAPDMQSVFAGAKQKIQEAYPTSEPAAPVG
jgi:hypothetical protein